MKWKNKDIKYAELSFMISMIGLLIFVVGVIIEFIFNIMEIAFCGIIIFGIAFWFFCIFVYKEEII